jgi:hypothetical protein
MRRDNGSWRSVRSEKTPSLAPMEGFSPLRKLTTLVRSVPQTGNGSSLLPADHLSCTGPSPGSLPRILSRSGPEERPTQAAWRAFGVGDAIWSTRPLPVMSTFEGLNAHWCRSSAAQTAGAPERKIMADHYKSGH